MELKETFTCPNCDKSYSSKNSLLNHLRTIHEIRKYKVAHTYPCKYCNCEYFVELHKP